MPELHKAPLTDSRQAPAHPSKPETFYGWWIVFAGTLILSVSSGIGFYGHGVILDPLRSLHGWPKATLSSAITLYFLTAGIMGMVIGRQVDRHGPKWVLIIGECFGIFSFATVSGLAGLFTMSGAAFGPTIAGLIYDSAQSYQLAFTIFAVMGMVASLVIFFARPSAPNGLR